jgi:hypothetical protein
MPKEVFIKSRNQTLVFPDEATQEQINESVNAMFKPTGKDMADYVEGVKNAAMEGQDLVDPFQQMSNDNYVLFKQYQADKKTSPGEFFGIAKDTFNQVRDELATGIGTAAYKTYQGEGVEVAKSLGEGMTAGMVGTYDILNKIFDPAQPIPRKEDFVGKVAKPNYASNAFMGMGGMIPNAVGQDRVNTEEDYNNLIASEKQRDSEIVNRLYAMESTMRNASIPEVARGGQFADPFLAAGLGGALVKVALKGGKTLITKAAAKAAAQSAVRAAGTEGVETAAETAARTAAQGVDNLPPAYTGPEGQVMRPFTPDPNAPMGAFASTAPSPMAQAGLRAAETTAGAVQFTAGLPSQGLKKLGEFVETVAPGMGTAAQGTVLGGSVVAGAPAVFLAQAKTTEKVAEFFRSFLRVSQEEASRAGRLERVALDPLTSPVVRKAAAGLAQFQPIARTVIDLSKGALKGGAAGSVVGGALGGLAERNLEGVAAGMGAGLALGGFYGSLNAGFDIGKEAFGGSTLRTRTNATGDINRFIASRPEMEQAAWSDAMRILVDKVGPERAASQMDALRVAEAAGGRMRIATLAEGKEWNAPGWLDNIKNEIVLNPRLLQADTPAHEATHSILSSQIKRQYRAQVEEAIYGIPDPVTGEIIKPGFLDDAGLARVAEQIRDAYNKGKNTDEGTRFQGLANILKNSTDKDSLIKTRSEIADELAADYGAKFFDRIRAGRFNPDRLPLVYRNALNAIDDGIYNAFQSVVFERGMDLGFDAPSRSFRDPNGKRIRVPKLDEIFKRAYSQKSTAETVVSKKPDLIPVKPADRAIWAKSYGGARGILNEDNTPKSSAQVAAEATARWQNMVNKLSPLPESELKGIEFSRDKSGKTTMTAKGQLSPDALTAILESDMLDQSANAVLRDVIISMQNPDKSTFDTRYYKAYERGQRSGKMVAGVYPPSHNEILPYAVTMNSQQGVNIKAVDMTRVRQRLATALNKPQFKDLYSNPADALKDFKRYLENATQVMPVSDSATLFGGGAKGSAKRNLFYEALGFRLRNGESLLNVPDSVIRKSQDTIKDYRVERFAKLVDSGNRFAFEEATTFERTMKNFQPSAFTPETLPNGESFTNPDGFRILNKTGSKLFRTYDDTGKLIGVAESKEKAVKKAMDEAIVLKNADKAESSKRFQPTLEEDPAYIQAVKSGDTEAIKRIKDAFTERVTKEFNKRVYEGLNSAAQSLRKKTLSGVKKTGETFIKLANLPETFIAKKASTSTNAKGIVNDLGLGNDVTVEEMGYNPIPGRGYANVIRLSTPEGFASIIHDDNYAWIDTSQVNKKKSDGTPIDGYNDPLSREKQQLGQASYQILGLFAKNNGLKLVPDPNGVSAIADIRRIDAMLASALRTGDTSYIDFAGIGTNPRATPVGWTGGKDYVRDVGVLATMSSEYATHFFPELNKLTLSKDGTKVILDGKAYTLDNLTKHLLVGDRSAVKTGVGEKTLRRAVFSKLDSLEFDGMDVAGLLEDSTEYMRGDERGGDSAVSIDRARAKLLEVSSSRVMFQPDPASPNILNGTDGSRIIKSTSGKYRVYLATGALAGVKETLESAQKLIERKSNK